MLQLQFFSAHIFYEHLTFLYIACHLHCSLSTRDFRFFLRRRRRPRSASGNFIINVYCILLAISLCIFAGETRGVELVSCWWGGDIVVGVWGTTGLWVEWFLDCLLVQLNSLISAVLSALSRSPDSLLLQRDSHTRYRDRLESIFDCIMCD